MIDNLDWNSDDCHFVLTYSTSDKVKKQRFTCSGFDRFLTSDWNPDNFSVSIGDDEILYKNVYEFEHVRISLVNSGTEIIKNMLKRPASDI